MVFVKVRETYDLHTTRNKMTVIGIHTPKTGILKKNYPGLLMQCKMYRPYSCDVTIACASMLPLDPQGVGTSEGDVAPEDVFNPILYKAMSNKGMSQLEARVNYMSTTGSAQLDVDGPSVSVDVDSFTSSADEFGIYYGLLAQTNEWKHANPQSGLSMTNLRPLVYEMVYNVGDMPNYALSGGSESYHYPSASGEVQSGQIQRILGSSRPMPFLPCTTYTRDSNVTGGAIAEPGFPTVESGASNASVQVPYLNVICGCIIVPPSRLHELFYRMVVEWTIEFSQIRSLSDLTTLASISASAEHYQNYSYSATKEALTGTSESILDQDTCMVSTNVDIKKVM